MAVKKKFPYRSALVACNGGCHVQEGQSCENGCIGCGICVSVCPFQAIVINENGVAQVDEAKCVACGKCVSTCPKHIIELLPAKKKVKVQCSSKDMGKNVIPNCSVGCIACKICEKNCPFDAIHVIDNLAVIDYTKCKACGICANKCPKGVLTGKRPAQLVLSR